MRATSIFNTLFQQVLEVLGSVYYWTSVVFNRFGLRFLTIVLVMVVICAIYRIFLDPFVRGSSDSVRSDYKAVSRYNKQFHY